MRCRECTHKDTKYPWKFILVLVAILLLLNLVILGGLNDF
jgi:hypothetical protein